MGDGVNGAEEQKVGKVLRLDAVTLRSASLAPVRALEFARIPKSERKALKG